LALGTPVKRAARIRTILIKHAFSTRRTLFT
jgi:hypothetical protein